MAVPEDVADVIARDLQRLPGIRNEAELLRGLLGTKGRVLLNGDASETILREEIQYHQIIHIAAHAEVHDDEPLFGSIRLSPDRNQADDGILNAFEIGEMHLSGRVLVLSGCNTGVQAGVDAQNGFVTEFLALGGRSLVVCLWNLDDQTVPTIMRDFYQELSDGARIRSALCDAKRRLIRNGNRDPFCWAGLVLVGGRSFTAKQSDQKLEDRLTKYAVIAALAMLSFLFVAATFGRLSHREVRRLRTE